MISTRRVPQCRVAFVGQRVLVAEGNQLVSVTTTKQLNQPAGTFEIVLLPTRSQWDDGNGTTERRGQRDQAFQGDIHDTVFWLEMLAPMTLVQIQMSAAHLPQNSRVFVPPVHVNRATTGGVRADSSYILMLGIVDTVTFDKVMTPQGPQRAVRVVGRDLGRALTDDTHVSFPFPIMDPGTKDLPPQALVYHPSDSRQSDIDDLNTRYFLRKGGGITSQAASVPGFVDTRSWKDLLLTLNTVQDVMSAVLYNAPGLNVTLLNGENLRSYIPAGEDIAPDVGAIRFLATYLLMGSGSVWSLLSRMTPQPWCEMFVDTVGAQARLIVRRPPWGRTPNQVQQELTRMKKTRRNLVTIDSVPLWDTDQVTTSACQVTQDAYHVVSESEVLSLSVGKSDREVINLYLPTALKSLGSRMSREQSAGITPPIVHTESIRRYGMRVFQPDNTWWSVPSHDGEDEISIVGELARDNLRLFFYFKDISTYLSGQLVLQGRPEIRIGDHVYLKEMDRIFYVESVSNQWQFGGQMLTTVQVSRGQPLTIPDTPLTPSVF